VYRSVYVGAVVGVWGTQRAASASGPALFDEPHAATINSRVSAGFVVDMGVSLRRIYFH
jgi:hypothetical protein